MKTCAKFEAARIFSKHLEFRWHFVIQNRMTDETKIKKNESIPSLSVR